ncbi:RICIN domain-containing protein [Streptomyces sp. NPDC002209]|uniref:RICIN domain-containing protein n=1 Tax=Streptomyces sp. NPDC002209 TaxID=3364638 RepID=UPI00369F13D9
MSVPDGVYLVRNAASGLLLQLEGGTRVRVGPEDPAGPPAARQWRISPVHSGGGIVHVVSVHNDKRLDVANASTESGTRVQVWRPNAFGAQEWIVEEHLDDPGVVSLIACISGLPLEGDEEGRARQCEDNDSPSQWWRLEPVLPRPGGRGGAGWASP